MGATENRRRNGHVLVWNQTDLPAEDARPKSKQNLQTKQNRRKKTAI